MWPLFMSLILAAFSSAHLLGYICPIRSHPHTRVKFLPFCSFNFLCRRCFTATIPLALQMLFGNPSRAIAFSDGWEFVTPSDFFIPISRSCSSIMQNGERKTGGGEKLPPTETCHVPWKTPMPPQTNK